ncbi:hypothetical protein [Methylobacterium haplocladii]|uniref:hypothetical protein n=1 Tax=Methylobacterium haplocladii TaxID=1176176 RepID=UPI0011BD5276|nr:hypothetical protein [Methylobacterium haplocladii]
MQRTSPRFVAKRLPKCKTGKRSQPAMRDATPTSTPRNLVAEVAYAFSCFFAMIRPGSDHFLLLKNFQANGHQIYRLRGEMESQD